MTENTNLAAEVMHLMTIEMSAWCGASGPGNGRASSQWREVTCPACTAKGMTWLRALVWDVLQVLPPSHEALGFALRAGRLGVTDEQGRPLAAACMTEAVGVPRDEPAPEPAGEVRPRPGEPGWLDVTCGICGAEHGTNLAVEEIACPECEARRCPHCRTWFGGEIDLLPGAENRA